MTIANITTQFLEISKRIYLQKKKKKNNFTLMVSIYLFTNKFSTYSQHS